MADHKEFKADKRSNDKTEAGLDLSVRHFMFPSPHRDGIKFIAGAGVIAIVLAALWWPLGVLGLFLTVGVYLFFRDPTRFTPESDDIVTSPADGTVCCIDRAPPPPELDMGGEPMVRVGVFMSVFNVHVNRTPVAGKILKTVYVPGKFLNASMDKASVDNERQLYLMEEKSSKARIAFAQIAGLIARRIVCLVKDGEEMRHGERFGLIRFGSRVDLYLPPDSIVVVRQGQTMIAGETVVGRLRRKQ